MNLLRDAYRNPHFTDGQTVCEKSGGPNHRALPTPSGLSLPPGSEDPVAPASLGSEASPPQKPKFFKRKDQGRGGATDHRGSESGKPGRKP